MRIGRDEWGLRLAEVTALRGTCMRRAVGCVLISEAGMVLATGYNGVASGLHHCNDHTGWNFVYANGVDKDKPLSGQSTGIDYVYGNACPGAMMKSGTGLEKCEAIHAEANALMQCRDVSSIHTAYVTASPCIDCTKLLMNTGCRRVVYRQEYPHPQAKALWLKRDDRVWLHLPSNE